MLKYYVCQLPDLLFHFIFVYVYIAQQINFVISDEKLAWNIFTFNVMFYKIT